MELMKRLWKEEEGQGLVEYALLLSLVVIIIVLFREPLSTAITGLIARVTTALGVAS